jgi:leucyl-tRNA synthetase
MMGYGTGAIMAVPAHDERDYAFAKKFNIDIIPVINGGDIENSAYTGDGEMINSSFLNGITNKKDAINRMVEELESRGIGKKGVQYKMKDWAFNRQRYWGEPIPIIHCPNCGMVHVPYEELPLKLPNVENFIPGEGGESPLAKISSFVNCKCPKCGGDAKRETDTMPQWAGSSWYFIRYIDPHNDNALADSDKMKYWLPVDWYNGGMEHVTRHLIYSRFWYKFLYDIGVVPTSEPYAKRTAQGLILGPDGVKMSKSRGNVIDPNEVVNSYGADTLRTYVLFMGDYTSAAPWSETSVKGCKRFLERVADLPNIAHGNGSTPELDSIMHKTIKKVSSDIEEMKFNTAIASLMTLINAISDHGSMTVDELKIFIKLLCPFAPHLCEEIWENLGEKSLLSLSAWPEYDESKTVDTKIDVAVQICGKFKGTITVDANISNDNLINTIKSDAKFFGYIQGKTIVKEICVPGKLVNIVVK